MNMRTPLKNARRLGSAKEGADHFWMQRVTAVANLFLGLYLVWLVASLAGADYATVKEALGGPVNAILLLLLIVSATMHMRLGMQVIVEDYVTGEGAKIVCLLANNFFAILVAAASVWAILKLSFGS
ncbi:MAG: succinate dehydrogenase, hydrophobic membrane anchor protein [Alphaproteobacteria bacterium]|nr:succinate dehydrogenase, hydrophobic membrane anchor protein [Alphaproteobacteria bacterium]